MIFGQMISRLPCPAALDSVENSKNKTMKRFRMPRLDALGVG